MTEPSTDDRPDDSADETSSSRGRTRTRTRTRTTSDETSTASTGTASTSTGSSGTASTGTASPRAADAADGGDADGDGDTGGRRGRRRRGGRGRGGRRGRAADDAGTATSAAESADTPVADDETSERDAASAASATSSEPSEPSEPETSAASRSSKSSKSPKAESRTPKSSKSSKSSRSSKGGKGSTSAKASGGDAPGEEAVAEAIRTGGTRMAARQGRRGASGGGGGRGGRRPRPQGISEEERQVLRDAPPRTMLVTTNDERTQIAVLEDRTVVEQYVTRKKDVTFVGNIYMGRVQNVLPGMEAAFIDIGKGRNGVLYAGEVLYDEFDLEEGDNPRIEDALKSGQTVLVQVTKDPMGSKGPRLTMHLSLAGRYMVLAPNSDVFGISRKLTDAERDRLRRLVKGIKPEHHGVIVRTAASEAPDEALEADLRRLLTKWEAVEARAAEAKALEACYEEPQLVVKVIRDNFGPDYLTCIVDDADLHREVVEYLDEVAPELTEKVHLYNPAPPADAKAEPESLFDAYHATEQLRKAMERKVNLPSGGYLIIERTEAMKVIDVNTGRFTGGKGANLEQVVLQTNLEAAEEIVRQLRLRDLGGIIVIDFIDMLLKANQDQVVRKLKRELLRDRTKTRVSDVSRLGLVQMTRKNVSQGLVEAFSTKCDTCEGRGYCIHADRIG